MPEEEDPDCGTGEVVAALIGAGIAAAVIGYALYQVFHV